MQQKDWTKNALTIPIILLAIRMCKTRCAQTVAHA